MYNLKILLFFIIVFNYSFAQKQNASILINKALESAKEENKQVFVNYLSTTCEVSKKMKKKMKNKIFNSDYIIVNIEVSEKDMSNYVNCSNPVRSFSERTCAQIKFPFWYVLDSSGNYTGSSFKSNNDNIGYPSTESAMNHFVDVIRNTSKFSAVKLDMIASSF